MLKYIVTWQYDNWVAFQNGGHFNKLHEITSKIPLCCISSVFIAVSFDFLVLNVDLRWDIGSIKDLLKFSGLESLYKIESML